MKLRLDKNHSALILSFVSLWMPLFLPSISWAQENDVNANVNAIAKDPSEARATESLEDMNQYLDELINLSTTVASKKVESTRVAPGIITVMTADEIRNMGARDLIDVLNAVPGFYFGLDVFGVTGLGMRGNWAHEGKVLLMIDDHEMNELSFSTLQFGNHFPVDQIQRIEIIRGPGSAVYGGNAELAVIQIFTKGAADLKGGQAAVRYGQMSNTVARDTVSLQAGKVEGDLSAKVAGYFGGGNRSHRTYTDLSGASYSMAGNSSLSPNQLTLNLEYKKIEASFLYDHYVLKSRDGYGTVLPSPPSPLAQNFDTYSAHIKANTQLTEALTLTPSYDFIRSKPWNSQGQDAIDLAAVSDGNGGFPYAATYFARVTDRHRVGLLGSYDFSKELNLVAGVEKTLFQGTDELSTFKSTGTRSIHFNSTALYSQLLWKPELFNMTVGARYEAHNRFGDAFVPRIALTKVIDQFHLKGLVSGAFRAPSIQNLDLNPAIKPERTTVYEVEAGYQFSKELFVAANIFDTTIERPIVYSVSHNQDSYANFDKTGSRGFEIESRWVSKLGNSRLTYSYYTSAGKNSVQPYAVPGRNDVLLGMPQHKVSWVSQLKLMENVYFSPTLIYMGQRYGYDVSTPADPSGVGSTLRAFSPFWLANLYFRVKDLGIKNMNLGLGVFNLLEQDFRYIQPFLASGGSVHPPLPGLSREFAVDLSYRYFL